MDTSEIQPSVHPEVSGSVDIETLYMWELLPSQVFRKLCTFLDDDTVKTTRLVCSAWKDDTDLDVGLTVKIDTRIADNRDFIKKIAIQNARVVCLEDPDTDRLFQHPGTLSRLILAGKVSTSWFMSQIQMFLNLTKLVLRGGFITNLDLQQFTNQETGAIESQPLFLPSLKSLEIMANEFSYSAFFLPLAIRLRDPARANQAEQSYNAMSIQVAKTISFILSSIRSPELKMLQIYAYEKPGVHLPESESWRFHPLETFLDRHKLTLREMYLPDFQGKGQMGHEIRQIPKQLSKLSVELSFFVGDREEDRRQDVTYWKNLLTSQTELKAIEIQLTDMPQAWLNETITAICTNNKRTLQFIDFSIQMNGDFEIDASIFSECQSLEVLRMTCYENEASVNNFTALPSSLKKIRMTSCFITVPNPAEIKKFTNLIMLEMSNFMLDQGIHERSLLATQAFLQLRNLNYLGISFNENAGNNAEMREILEHFSLFWDPRFRFSGMKINFGYQLKEGWSDEFFEETETDRDFINQREPENYPTWGTSFATIEEDHRVTLFRNLPLLLRVVALHDEDDDDDDPFDTPNNEGHGYGIDEESFPSDDDDEDDDFEFF